MQKREVGKAERHARIKRQCDVWRGMHSYKTLPFLFRVFLVWACVCVRGCCMVHVSVRAWLCVN
jgi:hypothetical protein